MSPKNTAPIKICIVEDEQIIRRSLRDYFSSIDGYQHIGDFGSVEEFLSAANDLGDIDVMLLDINLPGMNGIQGIQLIKESHPDTDIIILTTFNDPEYIFEALKKGAISYILKTSPIWDIKKGVEVVHAGGSYMSPDIARLVVQSFNTKKTNSVFDSLTLRQSEVLDAIVDGLSYKMIAAKFNISEHTANDHIKAIYKKLQVNSKAEAISKVLKHRS